MATTSFTSTGFLRDTTISFSPNPAWLRDTLPSSSYNGSVADVYFLVDSFELLGMSISLFFAAMYVGAVWFLLHSSESKKSLAVVPSVGRVALPLIDFIFHTHTRCRELISGLPHFSHLNPACAKGSGASKVGFVGDSSSAALSVKALPTHHGLRHLAVIMDGNRRYGKRMANEATGRSVELDASTTSNPSSPPTDPSAAGLLKVMATSPLNGHRAGGEKLMEFIEHCVEHNIEMLTVYAFSTENWSRSQQEIDVLMYLFEHFFQRIRASAKRTGIFIRFVATEPQLLPAHILDLMVAVENETRRISPRRIVVNCCVSYGGRSEIVQACKRIVSRAHRDAFELRDGGFHDQNGHNAITEQALHREMLRSITQSDHEEEDAHVVDAFGGSEPQVLLRTSGEARISNFLMFETAYSEFVFVNKSWPEMRKDDLVEVISEYCSRKRRFGK